MQTAAIAGVLNKYAFPIGTIRRHDGQFRWQLARAVPVHDERGELAYWFGSITDIQQRVEIEHALKEADACKDQFLATLRHELRNPLSPISNALQLWPHVAHDSAELDYPLGFIRRTDCGGVADQAFSI
jgi:signal transduction histidine kinase